MAASHSRATELVGKAVLLCLPFIALAASYFILDPFRVLYHYDSFAEEQIAIPNRDYISTQMFLNTYQQRNYHSFILGNSRTMAFHVKDWNQYIKDTASFHYDASGESLYGVWKKLEFIEEHGQPISNVLIICDRVLLKQTTDVEQHILRKDPRITGEWPIGFQVSFFKAYLSNSFYQKYLQRRLTGQFTPDMTEMLESRRVYYNPRTNDLSIPDIDQEIKKDSTGYYIRNQRLKPRTGKGTVAPAVIGAAQLRQLVAIRNIFKRNKTAYQFVISPLYQQEQLNPVDKVLLQRVFGAAHIHDYSGVNEFTQQTGNYYEESHYRPAVGRKIMQEVYAPKAK